MPRKHEPGGEASHRKNPRLEKPGQTDISQISTSLTVTPENPQAASAFSSSTLPNRINTYDNNGNIASIPMAGSASRNFTYDAENRTASATIVTGTGNIAASYVYDGLGQRVSKGKEGQPE